MDQFKKVWYWQVSVGRFRVVIKGTIDAPQLQPIFMVLPTRHPGEMFEYRSNSFGWLVAGGSLQSLRTRAQGAEGLP
jgi:hypothetical protein